MGKTDVSGIAFPVFYFLCIKNSKQTGVGKSTTFTIVYKCCLQMILMCCKLYKRFIYCLDLSQKNLFLLSKSQRSQDNTDYHRLSVQNTYVYVIIDIQSVSHTLIQYLSSELETLFSFLLKVDFKISIGIKHIHVIILCTGLVPLLSVQPQSHGCMFGTSMHNLYQCLSFHHWEWFLWNPLLPLGRYSWVGNKAKFTCGGSFPM